MTQKQAQKYKQPEQSHAKWLLPSPPFTCFLFPLSYPTARATHHNWTWMPNQSLRCAMFRYQAFHMALSTLRFYALLHPDSIKNGLTTFSQDWRPFCGWALSSATWLMGSPGGLSAVSLKSKVWNSEAESCVYRCTLAADILQFLKRLFWPQTRLKFWLV